METFICSEGHETFTPDLTGADKDLEGRYYITCSFFESEEEQMLRKEAQKNSNLSQIRGTVLTESPFMNAMDFDCLSEWSCEEPAYLVE